MQSNGAHTTADRGKRIGMTLYGSMLEAYRERSSVQHVSRATGVSWRTAHRAIENGWPSRGLRPIREVVLEDQRNVRLELARRDSEKVQRCSTDAAHRGADEASAARVSMNVAVASAQAALVLAEKLFERIKAGQIDMPAATPRVISLLARAADAATSAIERALKIERLRAGVPEETLGVRLGRLLDFATSDEVEYIARTGQLPARLLGFHVNDES